MFDSRLRDRLGASLRGYFGPPVVSNGEAHYLRQVGDRLSEIVVDEATGTITEENQVVSGKLQNHVTHKYEQVGGGIFLAVVTTIERAVPNASTPDAIELTLSNVRFSLRGGVK